MKKSIVVLAAAVFVCSAFAQPSNAGTDLENRISAKLVEAFGDDGKSIRVTVFEGKATLIGRVNERSTQELAEEVALFFPEVTKVDNELKSTKERGVIDGKLHDEAEDAKLETEVKYALEAEIGAHANHIEVEAADGVVSLRGTVVDASRYKFARDAAAKVKGVKKVIDLLLIKTQ